MGSVQDSAISVKVPDNHLVNFGEFEVWLDPRLIKHFA